MEKYFVYLLLVPLAGYTRGSEILDPFTTMMTCYDCVEILSGQLDPKYKWPICDGNYSRFKSKVGLPFLQSCFTINKTITSNVPNKGDKATILDRFLGDGRCNNWKLTVLPLNGRKAAGVLNRCSECKEPRCNYPLPKATDADMIECYQCKDKDEISPCDERNTSESKTTKKDGRIYSCYTITTYDSDKVKHYNRFYYEKDFCKVFIGNYIGYKQFYRLVFNIVNIDCKECTESRCNTDGYVPTRTTTAATTTTTPANKIPKNSASNIVLKYFYLIYFTLYCGQYKFNSFRRQ